MASYVCLIPAVLAAMISSLILGTAAVSPGSDLSFTATIAGVSFDIPVAENGTNVTLPVGAVVYTEIAGVSVEVPSPAPRPSSIRINNRLETEIYSEHMCNQSRLCETQIHFVKAEAESLRAEILVVIDFDDQILERVHVTKPIVLKGNTWSSTPGNMSVLENTSVGFNWTFTFLGPVYVTWDYLEPRDGANYEPVMTLDQKRLTIRPNWSPRIAYVNFTGSAVMNMSNTTKADNGLYKVQVVDVNGIFPAIRHSAMLTVVPEAILAFNIKVANMTFDLSVAENGTNVILPDGAVTLPTTFDVHVKIDATAPRPSVIRIQNRLGSLTNTTSCAHNRSCVIRLNFNETENAFHQTDIFTKIDFGIQNLPPIHIKGTAALKTTTSRSRISKVGLAVGILAGIFVIGIGIACFYWCKNAQNWAMSPDETQSNEESNTMAPLLHPSLPGYTIRVSTSIPSTRSYWIKIHVDKKPNVDPNVITLRQILTALLNTDGGNIELENEGNRAGYWTTIDEYIRDIESVVTESIPISVYNMFVELSGTNFPLRLLVKKSNTVITMDSHMYIRKSGHTRKVNDLRSIQLVMSQGLQSPDYDQITEWKTVTYGSTINSDSQLECIFWAPEEKSCFQNDNDRVSMSDISNQLFRSDTTKQSLLALPNMPYGGYFIVGLEKDNATGQNIVLGQHILTEDEEWFSKSIDDLLQHDPIENRRIWGDEARTPQKGIDWSIRFIPVDGGPPTERRRLIVIRVNHCQGGFWAKCPESFLISDEGSVVKMTFSSWKEAVTRTPVVTAPFAESETDENTALQPILTTSPGDTTTTRDLTDDSNVNNAVADTVMPFSQPTDELYERGRPSYESRTLSHSAESDRSAKPLLQSTEEVNKRARPLAETELLPGSQRHLSAMPVVQSIDEPNKVSALDSFITESEHLTCAEYCFRVTLNVVEESDVDPHVTIIKQIVTALLNTSGGIIELGHKGTCTGYWKTFDEYKIAITRVLLAFLPERVYNKCVKVSGNAFPLQLLVKKSDSVISVTSGMYIWKSDDGSTVNDVSSIRDVMTQDSASTLQDPFPEGTNLEYGKSISVNQGVKHTCLPEIETHSLQSDISVTRFLNDSAQRSLLAFPNNPSGGYVIVGTVWDERTGEHIVRGQHISNENEDNVSKSIEHFLQEDNNDNRRIWGDEARTPQEGREWNIRFIPVDGGPPTERRRLIVIRVHHCQGGFWAKCPESFMISEEGSVLKMTYSSWKEAVTKTSVVTASFAESETGENTATHHILKTPQEVSQSQKRDQITSTDGSNDTNAAADTVLNNMGYISFQEHSSSPQKSNIRDANTDLLLNACKFIEESDVFKFRKSMTEVMDSKELKNLAHSKAISAAMKYIASAQDGNVQSFCLITSSWTRDTSTQTAVDRPPGHILDVFVLDENGHIKFWAIVDEQANGFDRKRTLTYTLLSGRQTKRTLLLNQPYFVASNYEYIPSASIECRIYGIKAKGELCKPDTTNADYFNSTKHHLEGIRLSLAIVHLKTGTMIKSIYGEESRFTLTSEQLRVVHDIGRRKFTLVEGPPGSGKTHLALYISKNYNKCGYICTTESFKHYLIYQGLVENSILCVIREKDITGRIESGDFNNFEYLLFDDAHNTPFTKAVWKKLYKSVAGSDGTKLIVFGDTRYQNFRETEENTTAIGYIKKFCRKSKNELLLEKPLSVIHRNSKAVTSFVNSNFAQEAAFAGSSQTEGQGVDLKRMSNVWSKEESNELVNYIKDLFDYVEAVPIEPKQVVILVDFIEETKGTKNATNLRDNFKSYFEGDGAVHDAGTFPVTGLTIDTLNNFMGFDRRVCILLSDVKIQTSTQKVGHSFSNPKYKAFVASRGTSRADFVVEGELTQDLASKFQCHLTISEPHCLWSKPMKVPDVCWLRMDQTAALLYTSAPGTSDSGVSLVSLEGDNLDLTIDTSGIQKPECVACSTSGQTLVVTDGDTPHSWTVYHRQDSRRYDKKATYDIDRGPTSVKLTSDGDVLMLIPSSRLRGYSAADGRLLWKTPVDSNLPYVHDVHDAGRWMRIADATMLDPTGALTVGSADLAYVSDLTTVDVYSPGGKLLRTIRAPDNLPSITSVCADSTGRRLYVGHEGGSVSLFRDGQLVRRQLIGTGGAVLSLCLYNDIYLGIITLRNLHVYRIK